MTYSIKDPAFLKKLLWLDTFLGSSTAIFGLSLFKLLTELLGLSMTFLVTVSSITLCYAVFAFILAMQQTVSVSLLRILVAANWFWTMVSTILLVVHYSDAEPLGKIFLTLQIVVVGALAYFEGKQVVTTVR